MLTLTRNDRQGRTIDNLTYRYNRDAAGGLADNKLRGVGDGSGQALGVADQPATDNYTYDGTGNLVEDKQDKIKIEWTVYGKVKSVTKTDSSQTIRYLYDASGNRTVKTVRAKNLTTNAVATTSTYYVRDAQGNVLAVYDDNGTPLRQKEVYLYGSSRLGVFRPAGSRSMSTNGIYTRRLQQKEYELTDHLGNVRAVVGDYRQAEGGNVRAALRSYSDHYAFGLEMPGMVWKGGNSYRYGYNGKEQDADFQNNYDYGFRIYSPAVGRFLSVDPLTDKFPWLTPYQFAGNKPILFLDLDGLEPVWGKFNFDPTKTQPIEGFYDRNGNGRVDPSDGGNGHLLYDANSRWWVSQYEVENGEFVFLQHDPQTGEDSEFYDTQAAKNGRWDGIVKVHEAIALMNVTLVSLAAPSAEVLLAEKAVGVLTKAYQVKKAATAVKIAKAGESSINLTKASVADKLTRYLLNTHHPVGGAKAKWFQQALGFTKDNADDLAKQIIFDKKKAIQTEITQHGTKFNQVIPITGKNGRTIDVLFSFIRNNDGVTRLVTAIPAKK